MMKKRAIISFSVLLFAVVAVLVFSSFRDTGKNTRYFYYSFCAEITNGKQLQVEVQGINISSASDTFPSMQELKQLAKDFLSLQKLQADKIVILGVTELSKRDFDAFRMQGNSEGIKGNLFHLKEM